MKAPVVGAISAILTVGCSYDLDALLHPHDGGTLDHPAPADTSVLHDSNVDREQVPLDAGPPRDVHSGTCSLDGASAFSLSGQSTQTPHGAWEMLQTTTSSGPALRLPTGSNVPGCTTTDSVTSPPTQVFQWRVGKGRRIAATTRTGFCDEIDTRVYAVWSCGSADLNNPAACNDDSDSDPRECTSCMAPESRRCSTRSSQVELDVSPGDTVYFAVNGYSGLPEFPSNRGAFRIWVGENPARLVQLSHEHSPVTQCICQANSGQPARANFPDVNGGGNFPDRLDPTTHAVIFGRGRLRDRLGGELIGVSAQFALRAINTLDESRCDGTEPTFDLLIDGRTVASFVVPASYGAPVVFTLPYVGFAPFPITQTPQFQLTLRSLSTAPDCATYEFDRTADSNNPNIVTLYIAQ